MRITQRAIALTSLQGLNRNLDAVGRLQEQLTSGRLINAPSDSPTGTNIALQTRSDLAMNAQERRNISDAQSWLEQGGSTLQEMLNTANIVRDRTVQGLNTGANSAGAQSAIASEVSALREDLLGLANTAVQGRPLFGGVTAGPKAFNADGTFAGLAGPPVTRRIAGGEAVRVDVHGPDAFGPDGNNLFDIVEAIATDVVSNPSALSGHLDALDAVMKKMMTALAGVGAQSARVERAEQLSFDRSITLESQLAETENVDLPNTIMRLQMQQVGYEAALAATAKAISPTLMDYLRG